MSYPNHPHKGRVFPYNDLSSEELEIQNTPTWSVSETGELWILGQPAALPSRQQEDVSHIDLGYILNNRRVVRQELDKLYNPREARLYAIGVHPAVLQNMWQRQQLTLAKLQKSDFFYTSSGQHKLMLDVSLDNRRGRIVLYTIRRQFAQEPLWWFDVINHPEGIQEIRGRRIY